MKTLHPHERSNSVEIHQIERVRERERESERVIKNNFLILKAIKFK